MLVRLMFSTSQAIWSCSCSSSLVQYLQLICFGVSTIILVVKVYNVTVVCGHQFKTTVCLSIDSHLFAKFMDNSCVLSAGLSCNLLDCLVIRGQKARDRPLFLCYSVISYPFRYLIHIFLVVFCNGPAATR